MTDDKLAKFRKKPSLKVREAYRPNIYDASVGEAKEILRERYTKSGYMVKSIRRRDWHFMVHFGEDKDGRGKGPNGLSVVMCNWPYRNGLKTIEEATEWLIKEKIIKRPKKAKVKRRKRKKIIKRKGKIK